MIDYMMDMDDEAFESHSHKASMEIAHNVSMDDGNSTPRKKVQMGPIFDESEFGPSGQAPLVQESALVQ